MLSQLITKVADFLKTQSPFIEFSYTHALQGST